MQMLVFILPFLCLVQLKWLENQPVQQHLESHLAFRMFGIQNEAQETFRLGIHAL